MAACVLHVVLGVRMCTAGSRCSLFQLSGVIFLRRVEADLEPTFVAIELRKRSHQSQGSGHASDRRQVAATWIKSEIINPLEAVVSGHYQRGLSLCGRRSPQELKQGSAHECVCGAAIL